MNRILYLVTCLIILTACSENGSNEKSALLIETDLGDIKVVLYDDTPKHRDNIIKLAKKGFYDDVLFHRVIKDFMIQTGDPDSKDAETGARLGAGGPGYTIPAEIVYPQHFHKRGALAAARQGDNVNPERASSGSQFYIVTGRVVDEVALDAIALNARRSIMDNVYGGLVRKHRDQFVLAKEDTTALKILQDSLVAETRRIMDTIPSDITEDQREVYTTIGGTPHLDGAYTVFGEVVEGIDVVDKIQSVATGEFDRPLEDIKIKKVKVIKQ